MDLLVSQILTHNIMTDNVISANFMSVKNRNKLFFQMIRSLLLWIALGVLATSGEARLWRDGRERNTNGPPQGEGNINEYVCKVRHRVYVLASK